MNKENTKKEFKRPPVVAVMGHIDHGKSTLLDYIRKTNITEKEAGGITQHIAAYEVEHTDASGAKKSITFLDTPGHEAFGGIRSRGARVADIAILVVSAEDGVKPQTVEAYQHIKKDNLQFIVAINKIDKPNANIDRTKQNLAENEIYVEGFGGNVPWVAVSAKTGEGINDLLELIILNSEILELKSDLDTAASGTIIESSLDPKKGISTVAIIQNGILKRGEFAVSGQSLCPLRIVEDFKGKSVNEVYPGSPVKIIGWDKLPTVGATFVTFQNKKEAVNAAEEAKLNKTEDKKSADQSETFFVPLIIKTDTAGSLDAIVHEVKKLGNEKITPKIISAGIGSISESDIKLASADTKSVVIAFHTKIDRDAEALSLRSGITINSFDIIYKLSEWLAEAIKERTPTKEVEKTTGILKVLKTFSQNKDKQVIGGRVESGAISVGESVKIMRREAEIGRGKIRELQTMKQKTSTIAEGNECGLMVEAKMEIAPGDKLETFIIARE